MEVQSVMRKIEIQYKTAITYLPSRYQALRINNGKRLCSCYDVKHITFLFHLLFVTTNPGAPNRGYEIEDKEVRKSMKHKTAFRYFCLKHLILKFN